MKSERFKTAMKPFDEDSFKAGYIYGQGKVIIQLLAGFAVGAIIGWISNLFS